MLVHLMRTAQQLYEGIDINGDRVGLITYMRTDSVTLSKKALADAKYNRKIAAGLLGLGAVGGVAVAGGGVVGVRAAGNDTTTAVTTGVTSFRSFSVMKCVSLTPPSGDRTVMSPVVKVRPGGATTSTV